MTKRLKMALAFAVLASIASASAADPGNQTSLCGKFWHNRCSA
jgi:hypothetical protein